VEKKMTGEKRFDVVGLGSCTMDVIFEVDDVMRFEMLDRNSIGKKYVAIEHSSKVNVKKVHFYPGGSAANIAVDLSNIGFKTAYFGGIGDDSSGEACLKDLRNHRVDVTGMKVYNNEVTAVSVILITPWGKDRSILAYKGANDLFSPHDVPEPMVKNTRCFVWTSLTSDIGIEAIKKSVKLAKDAGAVIAGAPSISIIKKRHAEAIEMIKEVDITSMNDEELEALTGTKDILAGMQSLLDMGLKIVNITFGKNGQWITDGKTLVKTLPPKIFPKDTTGAGDATMAGVIYGFLEKKDLPETARIAASLSAMEIEGSGVRVGIPNAYSELVEFMKKHNFSQEILTFSKNG
jgi:sugar/nucleoside kinase (ribokinase family)